MFELAYTSRASEMMAPNQLEELLAEAIEFNTSHDITGLLLYNDGIFFQVLEGEEYAVRNLFANIKKDFRHYDVRTIYEQSLVQRHFKDWSMRFFNVSPDLRQQGHSDIIHTKLNETENWVMPSTAMVLVDAFQHL